MTEGTNGSSRPWQEIAREASTEQNPQRLIELTKELNKALDEQRAAKQQGVAKKVKSA